MLKSIKKPDGETIYVHILKAPVLGADGQVRGVQGMFWDVSARHRVEEKLRENAERTRLILDTAYDAFVGVDSEGRIIDWNPQAESRIRLAARRSPGATGGRDDNSTAIPPGVSPAVGANAGPWPGDGAQQAHRNHGHAPRRQRVSRRGRDHAGADG